VPVRLANGVTLGFANTAEPPPQHFAFLVGDAEFDAALARIRDAGGAFYANSHRDGRGEINQLYGGRGVYFEDLDGNMLELITQPYGPRRMRWVAGAAVDAP
jgi:catechol 2,3-dioxygenase-like lactoylglutathione lyase family enzyme